MSESFVTPWTVARQFPLSMRSPRQEYWSGLLFHSPGDIPNPGMESVSPALAGGLFTTKSPGKPPRYIAFKLNPPLLKNLQGLPITLLVTSQTGTQDLLIPVLIFPQLSGKKCMDEIFLGVEFFPYPFF